MSSDIFHLRRGVLVDGSGPDPIGVVDILIEKNIIREVSTEPLSSVNANVIDLSGKVVLPGLIDAHVHAHIFDNNLVNLKKYPPSYTALQGAKVLGDMLRRGFTTVRDAGGADWGLKQAIEEGLVAGPRLLIAGHALSQTGGHGDYRDRTDTSLPSCNCSTALASVARVVDGAECMRRAVREEIRKGADHIKVMASGGLSGFYEKLDAVEFSGDELLAAVYEAQARGTYVMAHAYTPTSIEHAIKAGVRSIEHGNLIDARVAALAARSGTYIVPTLSTFWLPDEKKATVTNSAALKSMLEKGLEAVATCVNAGVLLGFGSDLMGQFQTEQAREFQLRREVQPAYQVIDSATRINARLLKKEGQLGVIKAGALADLIVVEGDPLRDISILGRPEKLYLSMKNGKVITFSGL